jgi:hypothetical protein
MLKKLLIAVLIMPLFIFAACEKKPVNRLVNPSASETTGSSTWPGPWVVYDDEIKTGGGVGRFTTPEGQELDFSSRENPHSGNNCIKFSWDGGEVTAYANPPDTPADYVEHGFVGFSFKVQNDSVVGSPATKDLSPGHYTRVSFYAMGTLSSNVTLRIKGPGTGATESPVALTSDWQLFTVPVNGNLADSNSFANFVLATAGGVRSNGGTVFLDDIRLTN